MDTARIVFFVAFSATIALASPPKVINSYVDNTIELMKQRHFGPVTVTLSDFEVQDVVVKGITLGYLDTAKRMGDAVMFPLLGNMTFRIPIGLENMVVNVSDIEIGDKKLSGSFSIQKNSMVWEFSVGAPSHKCEMNWADFRWTKLSGVVASSESQELNGKDFSNFFTDQVMVKLNAEYQKEEFRLKLNKEMNFCDF